MPAGKFRTEKHQHTRYQLLYSEGGVLHFFTDAQRFVLPAKHGAWIPAGLVHSIESSSPHLYLRTLYLGHAHSAYRFPNRLTIFPISSLAREMILHTQNWDYEKPITQSERAFYEAISFLIADWCRGAMALVLPTTAHKQVQTITQYMLNNLDKDLTIKYVSDKFGMSSRTLMRLFRGELDTTFQGYLRIARVIKALELLTLPDISITEVSLQVGYRSMSSFSQTFKAFVGKSPSAFRYEVNSDMS
ncbi:MAG: helix-turn-helix transcriptional regulator, partial [Chloroflexota bacterium]